MARLKATRSAVQHLETLEERVTALIRELNETRNEVADALAAFEPTEEGTVISWYHQYDKSIDGKEYEYVAIKIRYGWFITGNVTHAMVWSSMCKRWPALAKGDFYIASGWNHATDV